MFGGRRINGSCKKYSISKSFWEVKGTPLSYSKTYTLYGSRALCRRRAAKPSTVFCVLKKNYLHLRATSSFKQFQGIAPCFGNSPSLPKPVCTYFTLLITPGLRPHKCGHTLPVTHYVLSARPHRNTSLTMTTFSLKPETHFSMLMYIMN